MTPEAPTNSKPVLVDNEQASITSVQRATADPLGHLRVPCLSKNTRNASPTDLAVACCGDRLHGPSEENFSRLWYTVSNTGARWPKWLEREFTDRKVRGSNPTSASRLPLSRLGQPGSIPALVPPSGCMAVRHQKGATAERLLLLFIIEHGIRLSTWDNSADFISIVFRNTLCKPDRKIVVFGRKCRCITIFIERIAAHVPTPNPESQETVFIIPPTIHQPGISYAPNTFKTKQSVIDQKIPAVHSPIKLWRYKQLSSCYSVYAKGTRWLKWLEHEFTDREVRGSNPTSASRIFLSGLGQLGVSQPSCFLLVAWQLQSSGSKLALVELTNTSPYRSHPCRLIFASTVLFSELEIAQWLRHQLTDRKLRGSNPNSASRLLLSGFGQPDSIPAPAHHSVGIAARL
ncbi:hypothetical protein CSKR_110368 [Clonorchis sinensis]|uniref:Uncharacterized protein n=1 Tax=Clonorchis sinensis TaxID=79923 RepID=A0A3R7FRB8_CLOSI|nr:hypothetical protein CSKR_110368 [Clonorchis sinensis]